MIQSLFLLGDVFKEGFVGIILVLDTLIYGLIGSAFRVFMAIASARLLSSEAYYAIANKVYLIIGVLMLFVLSYGILKAIVNPDEGTKQLGPALLKKIAIAVVGLAVTPAIFNLMYQTQGLVLEHDILAKLFFRSENTDRLITNGPLDVGGVSVDIGDDVNPDDYVKVIGGSYTATTIWQAFFYPAPDSGLTAADITADPSDYYIKAAGAFAICAGIAVGGGIAIANGWNPVGWVVGLGVAVMALTCGLGAAYTDAANTGTAITDDEISLEQAYALTAAGESFGLYTIFLDNYLDDGEISYLFGISTLCGAFALYAFASFSIDMGIRAAKLAYFQVIAPIPLVMQILPGKEGVFKDYTKKVVHTFLEVFIRISVVYIVIYLICHLQDLFSSVDALWGNTDLTTPELMFAMAFLIIGLIIFCKEAPKFFGETLGINSGDMKLGLREKLAKGGVYNAAGVGYGGITSAVRNWRNYKSPDGKNNLLGRIASTAAGFGSGAARATKSFIGPGHNDAKSWKDAKNAGEKAAQAAADKRDQRDARERDEFEARKAAAEAQAAYEAAIGTPEEEAAYKRLVEARMGIARASAAGVALDNAARKLDSWSVGSVSMAQEEADIKFASGLDKLKDSLREEAYKKDRRTQARKTTYEELQAKRVSEYRDGWDEQSYNEAVRKKAEDITLSRIESDAAVTAKRDELERARSTGASADRISTLESELASARAAARTTIEGDSDIQKEISADAVAAVKTIAKKSDEDIYKEQVELARQVKVAKDLMEASADEYVAVQLGDSSSDPSRIVRQFLNDNANYISENAGRSIATKVDANGRVLESTTIADMLSEFGSEAASRRIVDYAAASGKRTFTLEIKDSTSGATSTVDYRINVSGTYDAYDKATGRRTADPSLSFDELMQKVIKESDKGNEVKFEGATAATTAGDKGKKASKTIPSTEDYRKKADRKREAEKK